MRNGGAIPSKSPTQSSGNTERSEQKDQGHAPGQCQGVKPIAGSRDRVPSGLNFLFDFAHKKWAEPQ